MIYTLTANPSIDYQLSVLRLNVGEVNRSQKERMIAGGKGLNIAKCLKNFGVPVKTFGVVAGNIGDNWLKLVKEEGIDVQAMRLPYGETRVNVKILGIDQTEINAQGPACMEEQLVEFGCFLDQLKDGDTFCLAGNVAPGMGSNLYARAMDRLASRNIKFVLDCSGDLMRCSLPCHPYLIKPNKEELKNIANTYVGTKEDVIACCERLLRMGAQNVLVSLGKEGAIWVGGDGLRYEVAAPKGRVKNSVGAGDSMVAGFLYAQGQGLSIEECVRFAVATGSASAFSENFATKEDVYGILDSVEGHEI